MDYLEPILTILLPVAIGIGLLQFGVFDQKEGVFIRRFCIQFTVPLLVFVSMFTAETEVFGQFGPMVFSLFVMTALFFGVGHLGSLVVRDPVERTAIHAGITFGNYGWIGWAVANVVLGAAGFQRAVFFTALWWPAFYGYGLLIGLAHSEKEQSRGVIIAMLKRLAPTAVALGTGIGCNLARVTLPAIVFDTVKTFGNMSVPLILLSVGLQLRFSSLVGFLPKAAIVSLARIAAGPPIGIGVALLGRFLFHMDTTSVHVVLLIAAMPVATMTPVLGDNFPMKSEIVGASIVLSTLLSLVTLPLWIPLVEKLPL